MLLKIMGFFVEVFTHQNWGLWFSIVLMIIDADVKRSLTFSNVLKLAYTALEQINKVFTFACKVVKYLKGFFCPVTLECFCMLHLFTTKIVHSWEALWTIFWLFWLFRVSTFNFVFKDEIASVLVGMNWYFFYRQMNCLLSNTFCKFSLVVWNRETWDTFYLQFSNL